MANHVHLSDSATRLLKAQDSDLNIVSRGTINVKGKGKMSTSWLLLEGQSQPDGKQSSGKPEVTFLSNPTSGSGMKKLMTSVSNEKELKAASSRRETMAETNIDIPHDSSVIDIADQHREHHVLSLDTSMAASDIIV